MKITSPLPYKTHFRVSGFTLMEMMLVVTVIAILASLSLPSFLFQRQQNEVVKAYRLAISIRDEVSNFYLLNARFPEDNEEAKLPEPDKLIGNNVIEMKIVNGAIHIRLGNKVTSSLHNKIITMRPAVVPDSPLSPISWLCGHEEPVAGMEAVGDDRTDVDRGLMPASCDG